MRKFEVGKITQLSEDKSKKENTQKRNPIGFFNVSGKDDSGKKLDRLGFSGQLVEKDRNLKTNGAEEETDIKDDEKHIDKE